MDEEEKEELRKEQEEQGEEGEQGESGTMGTATIRKNKGRILDFAEYRRIVSIFYVVLHFFMLSSIFVGLTSHILFRSSSIRLSSFLEGSSPFLLYQSSIIFQGCLPFF